MSVMVDDTNIRNNSVLGVMLRLLVVSLVAIVGWKIALPGLDESFMAAQTARGLPSQLSVLALGVAPILTALALGQVVRLVFPSAETSLLLVIGEGVVALGVAASQAYAIAQAMLAMGLLTDPSALGVFALMATLVGGAALLLFLSRQVVLPGLVAGFWILWLLPALLALPAQLSLSFDLLRTGAVAGVQALMAFIVLLVAFGLTIFATRMVRAVGTRASASVPLLNIVVWPPLLAASAGGYALTPLVFFAPDALPDTEWLRIYILAVTAILIPVFAFGYRRFFLRKGLDLPVVTLLVVCAVQIVLVLGAAYIADQVALPLPFGGTTIIVLVAVAYAIIDAVRPGLSGNTGRHEKVL